jgi:WD40 repeat protein
VSCLASNPENHNIIATGEISSVIGSNKLFSDTRALIYVWNLENLDIISKLETAIGESVLKICFFSNAHYRLLALLNGPRGSRVVVYNYACQLMIAEGICGSNVLLDIAVKDHFNFTTVGVNHICFWNLEGNTLKSKPGIWGSIEIEDINVVEYAFAKRICFTGSNAGRIVTWLDGRANRPMPAHSSSINVLYSHDAYLYSGCNDGKIRVWSFGTIL